MRGGKSVAGWSGASVEFAAVGAERTAFAVPALIAEMTSPLVKRPSCLCRKFLLGPDHCRRPVFVQLGTWAWA